MEIKLAIIEDHADYRESIKLIFNTSDGYTCLKTFPCVEDSVNQLDSTDVLLLDINLPGKSGIESISKLKEAYPNMQIIILTVFEDDSYLSEAVIKGADGYLLKKTPPVKLLQYVKEVYDGGSVLSPEMTRKAMELLKKESEPVELFNLSDREIEVMKLIARGKENQEIADELFISVETVKNHLRSVYKKLNVHSKTQAIIKSFRHKIIS